MNALNEGLFVTWLDCFPFGWIRVFFSVLDWFIKWSKVQIGANNAWWTLVLKNVALALKLNLQLVDIDSVGTVTVPTHFNPFTSTPTNNKSNKSNQRRQYVHSKCTKQREDYHSTNNKEHLALYGLLLYASKTHISSDMIITYKYQIKGEQKKLYNRN